MKHLLIFFFIILFNNFCYAKKNDSILFSNKLNTNTKDAIFVNKNFSNENKATVDTIFIFNKNVSKLDDESNWSKNMPWIGAISIGILTIIGNLIVSYFTRKSNKSLAEQQIENSKIIADNHIQLLKSNSEREFKKTIISGSIQAWINDYRSNISELLSTIEVIRFKEVINDESILKIHFLISKCEIMLGSLNYPHLSANLKELKEICLQIPTGNKNYQHIDSLIDIIKSDSLIVLKEQSEKSKILD